MKKQKHLAELLYLAQKLENAANARPYDPEAYNSVIDSLNSFSSRRVPHRRRRPWVIASFIFFLLTMLAIVIGLILWPA